jgi:hypothetical protein
MAWRFRTVCLHDRIEVHLEARAVLSWKGVDRKLWTAVPQPFLPTVGRLLSLEEEQQASWFGDRIAIDNHIASEFQGIFAAAIALPPVAPVMLEISFSGSITDINGRESNGRMQIIDLSRPLGPASRLSGDRPLGVSADRCSPWSSYQIRLMARLQSCFVE